MPCIIGARRFFMNKRILFLIPLLSIALTGCNGGDSVSTRSTPSTTKKTDKEINNIDNPYTVAQFLDYCNQNVAKDSGTYSEGLFYIKAQVYETAYFEDEDQNYFHIIICDSLTDATQVPALSVNAGKDVSTDTIYRGDEVLISGYGEYYDGRFTIYPYVTTNYAPTLHSHTKKDFAVAVEDGNNVTYDKNPAGTYTNGEKVSFKPTANEGCVIKYVLNNGVTMSADKDGNYSFVVNGPTNIIVRSVKSTLEEEDLEKGNYEVKISKSVLPLELDMHGASSKPATSVNFEIGNSKDSFDKLYKKLTVNFSEGCVNSYKYDEFGLGKGKSMLLSTTQTNMKITSIDIDFYSASSSTVYKADNGDDKENIVKGTAGTSSRSDGSFYSYEINGQNAYVKNSPNAGYSYNMIYYVTVKLSVE